MNVRDSEYFEILLHQIIKNHHDDTPEELAASIMEKVKSDDYSDSMEDDSTLILINV